jgi:hypothetical protein
MLAMDQFKDLRGFTNYAARLPVGVPAAISAWIAVAFDATVGALLRLGPRATTVRVECCDPDLVARWMAPRGPAKDGES